MREGERREGREVRRGERGKRGEQEKRKNCSEYGSLHPTYY
mgnify:CR=1 FL=1